MCISLIKVILIELSTVKPIHTLTPFMQITVFFEAPTMGAYLMNVKVFLMKISYRYG